LKQLIAERDLELAVLKVEYPRISSTDVDDLRLLGEWHEVRTYD
jgi:hypothetical protein